MTGRWSGWGGVMIGAATLLFAAGAYGQGESGASEENRALWVSAAVALVAFAMAAVLIIRARRPSAHRRGRRLDAPLIIPTARGAGEPRSYEPLRRPEERPEFAPPSAPRPAATPVPPPAPAGRGATVTFAPPPEGTLQLLPGRLEVVEGEDRGQNIRFVRMNGPAEVTFGRSEGPPYRHVQLHSPTVSREHARMCLENRTWTIVNLSQTNPVVVNGEELQASGSGHSLHDGDRVEMGEVVFEFRDH